MEKKFIHRLLGLLLVSFALLSCDANSERVQEVRKNIAQIEKDIREMEENIKTLQDELSIVWVRSLHYRFPGVMTLEPGEEITPDLDDQGIDYIKSFSFKSSGGKITFDCNYQAKRKGVVPSYALYFFDSRGINIHKEHIKYKKSFMLFQKKLPVGKVVNKKYKIELLSKSRPIYFVIGKVS